MKGEQLIFPYLTLHWIGSGECKDSGRDLETFPVCLTDSDCSDISSRESEDFRCFQYMCFPWKSKAFDLPFNRCQRRSECLETEDCYRHQDRRKVFSGICLSKEEMTACFDHSECQSEQKCVNGYCGDKSYFKALLDTPCTEHSFCQDLLLGTHCCHDLSDVSQLSLGQATWAKRCCTPVEGQGPVIVTLDDMSQDHLAKLDKKLEEMEIFQENRGICEALD